MLRSFPLSLLCLLLGCSPEPGDGARETISLEGQAMGTTWEVIFRELPENISQDTLRGEIEATLERIESLASHWRTDTPVSQFNQTLDTQPFLAPPQLIGMLEVAQRINQITEGAFDVTVAPLVNLWGFGPIVETRRKIPSAEEIENALASMGQDKLELLPKNTIRKTRADLQIDLSALAKGYAIDQVAQRLDERKIARYLIELGGELRAKGQGWQVGLEHPQAEANATKIHRIIALEDSAVATSGNYRLSFTDSETGNAYSHIIDPRTGRPVDNQLVAVSVIAPTAMEADAWATALLVLGSDKGLQLAEKESLSAVFVEEASSGLKVLTTKDFVHFKQ